MRKRISVVIPLFNLERFIGAAIESVLAQTLPADEIIVIDDGSTDCSTEIINSYNNKVKLFSMPRNGGVLRAVLRGINESDCDILAFLDADDIWEPEKLEKVSNKFAENASIIAVTHNYSCINSAGAKIPYHADRTYANMSSIRSLSGGDSELESRLIKDSILSYKGVWLGSAWCFLKSALNISEFNSFIVNVGMPDYVSLTHQDQPLAAFIILDPMNEGKLFGYVDSKLFRYRIYGSNSSGDISSAPSACRSVARSLATVYGTMSLVCMKMQRSSFCLRQRSVYAYLSYLSRLYGGARSFHLLVDFRVALRGVSVSRIPYEIVRFLVVYLFGIGLFLRLKRFLTLHR